MPACVNEVSGSLERRPRVVERLADSNSSHESRQTGEQPVTRQNGADEGDRTAEKLGTIHRKRVSEKWLRDAEMSHHDRDAIKVIGRHREEGVDARDGRGVMREVVERMSHLRQPRVVNMDVLDGVE